MTGHTVVLRDPTINDHTVDMDQLVWRMRECDHVIWIITGRGALRPVVRDLAVLRMLLLIRPMLILFLLLSYRVHSPSVVIIHILSLTMIRLKNVNTSVIPVTYEREMLVFH